MQAVGRVVDRQPVPAAVESKGAAGDPVGVAADDSPEVRAVVAHVGVQGGEAEDDVGRLVVAVGHLQGLDDAPVGEHCHRHALVVGQRVAVDDGAVGQLAEHLDLGLERPRWIRHERSVLFYRPLPTRARVHPARSEAPTSRNHW